jgi:transcriptional regulator with XRE-family HTH domain
METIGERLKQIMDNRGISQYRLAKISGASQPTISALVNDQTRKPNTDTIQKIAAALRCSVDEIIGDAVGLEIFQEMGDDYNSLSPKARQLFGIFEQLNDAGQDFLIAQAESILSQPVFRKDGAARLAE